jgi:aerobic-type carbon monoxide dehydrogenase small subunit (CoxS/CutS family)
MNNQEINSNTKLNDNNLEKVTGGFTKENRFQCPFCQHSPFSTNTELINHIQVKHRSKIDTD